MKKKIYPMNTYDFGDLKVSVNDTKPTIEITLFTFDAELNEQKSVKFKIAPRITKHPDNTLMFNKEFEIADLVFVQDYVYILCVYKYLKENNIQNELLDEIKKVIVPKLNEENVRENLDKKGVEEVYDICAGLDLLANKEVQNNFKIANDFYEKNNKELKKAKNKNIEF